MDFVARLYRFYRYKFYERHPNVKGANRVSDKLKELAQRRLETPDKEPESIFDKENWDNLIILDACRHDLYEEVNGSTPKRTTLGGHSREFVEKTFSEGDFSDYVYITANPHFFPTKFKQFAGRDVEDAFHAIYHTYKTDWDDGAGIVLPEPVVRDAKSAAKLFPDKKLIIHFMQPHHPFLDLDLSEFEEKSIWKLAEQDKINRQKVWEYYKRNIEYVMPHAKELAEELEGETYLTSDHGNLVGENGLYHHPYGAPSKPVREVPWLRLSGDSNE